VRNLIFSLYVAVFLVLMGLGWAIDEYYNSEFEATRQLPYEGYRELLSLTAELLSDRQSDRAAMQQFLDQHKLKMSLEPLSAIPLPPSLELQRDRGEIFILQSYESDTLYRRIQNSDWLLSIEIMTGLNAEQESARYVLTMLFYAGVAIMLLLWLLPLLRAITQLNRAAIKIGSGDLTTRVENPNSLYLKPLKTEFNAMAQRLQQLNENNQLMSQAVSHELRTPLSRLRFALDMIQGRKDQQQREQDILRMEADLDDMEDLINELLNYSRLDQQPAIKLEPIKIEALIEQRILRRVDANCQINFNAQHSEKLIAGDHDYLCKLVDNLLQNACRYAQQNVTVRCRWGDTRFFLSIEDDGPGVPEDQIEQIFKPFYRVKNQAVKKSSGFGLGLAIVNRIVQWHAGSVLVSRSTLLGGACFEVSLPINSSAS
jgi:signal transduction histidine kinase